jgi:hypothetical protein
VPWEPPDPPEWGATPGTYSVNPLDPGGSLEGATEETGGLIRGLKVALFGTDQAVANEKGELTHGGLIGDVPIAGDLTRFFGGGLATASDAFLGGLGGLAERVPNYLDPSAAAQGQRLNEQFEAIPQEWRDKFMAEAGADKGLFGTGILSNEDSKKSQAIRAYQEVQAMERPDLFSGLYAPPASVADSVSNLLGGLGAAQRVAERGVAGAAKPQTNNMNRLQEIMSVGSGAQGRFAFGDDDPEEYGKLLPVEQLVYERVAAGDWTEDEGLTYLASHGAGLSHSQWLQIAGTFATDPLNVASLGAAGLATGGRTGVSVVANLNRAQEGLKAAQAAYDAASGLSKVDAAARLAEATKALQGARAATVVTRGSSARLNVLGRLGETEEVTAGFRRLGVLYGGLDGTAIGRVSKAARTVIDPLHAIDLRLPAGSVDLLSDTASKAVVQSYGFGNHLKVLETLHDISPELYNQFVDNFAIYAGNLTRRVIGIDARNATLASGEANLPGLIARSPDDVVAEMMQGRRKDILGLITEEGQRHRIRAFDEAAMDNLAVRMHKMYGVKEPDEWRAILNTMNEDQLSMLHASTYGRATQQLVDGVAIAMREGAGTLDTGLLQRLVLLRRDTLTRLGAEGILSRLGEAIAAGDRAGVIAEITEAQRLYPELRYFSFNSANPIASAERFAQWLSRKVDHLPMQVTDEESAGLHTSLQELQNNIEGAYTLGFRPEDEYLWGLDRVNTAGGRYAPVGDVWVDHVGIEGVGPGYRAGRYLDLNFMGKPILGDPTSKRSLGRIAMKPVDYMEAGLRTLKSNVSGTMIAEAANARFEATLTTKHGFTDTEARSILEALREHVGQTRTIANPRGLSPTSMMDVARGLIPRRFSPADFTERDLLAAVLDAYEGDIRFVGATQRLTGAAKRIVGEKTGINFLGQIAEHAYPLLKFRLNVVFQAQEKIEPWVLNAQRGAMLATGAKMSPSDVVLARNLERMTGLSLTRMGDMADQFEYSAQVLFGKKMAEMSVQERGALQRVVSFARSLTDVQGTKRISMLRTFKKGLGKEMRSAWDEAYPGRNMFDEMKANAQLKQGVLLSDDDFAVQLIGEQMLGNDIVVQRVLRSGGKVDYIADFKASMAPGTWATPGHMGEIRPLDIDGMTELLGWSTRSGKAIKNEGELRAAIAEAKETGEDLILQVEDSLFRHGADPDYVRRVRNALDFSWEGFWQQATKRYNLTSREARQLQDMVGAAADLRGVSPVEFASQVWSPVIQNGMEGGIGDLGKSVRLLRGIEESVLDTLAAPVGEAGEYLGTRDMLVNQLAKMFSSHLDPSAKKALLLEFKPDLKRLIDSGDVRLDQAEVLRMWEEGGDDWLGRSIIDGLDATEGDIFAANLPRSAVEANELWPMDKPISFTYRPSVDAEANGVQPFVLSFDKTVDDSIDALPPALKDQVLGAFARVKAEYPGVNIDHIRVDDLSKYTDLVDDTPALATGMDEGHGVIVLNRQYFNDDYENIWAGIAQGEELARTKTHFFDPVWRIDVPRESNIGATFSADVTPAGTIRHELGHLIDSHMRRDARFAGPTARTARGRVPRRFKAYNDFARRIDGSPAHRRLSEYSHADADEMMGEWNSLATDPDWRAKARAIDERPVVAEDLVIDESLPIGTQDVPPGRMTNEGPQTVEEAVEELRGILADTGLWKEPPAPTVNPDVIRAHRYFSRWVDAVVAQGLFKGGKSPYARILQELGGIPTEGAVPFNLTEQRLYTAVADSMRRKWSDAFRLQYFAQSRTMLERSVNHPMFGIYPASYMWGKILPEVVQFIAQRPFGVRTGAAAYAMHDVQRAVALQRELDPEFDAMMEKAGTSQMLWMLGYLLPSLPWDVSAAWPAWMRDLADQGLTMDNAAAQGVAPGAPDFYRSVTKSAEVISPMRPYNQIHAAAKEFDEVFIHPQPEEEPDQIWQGPNLDAREGPVQGTDLEPTLQDALSQLLEALSP